MKKFVFLYPTPEIIDFEIKNHGWSFKGGEKAFRARYKKILNQCIDIRYRQKGFKINYAVFDGSPVSDIIHLRDSDKIIEVGLDFKTHIDNRVYPNQDFILDKLGKTRKLRIAGFHLWDCVERLARRAHEKGVNVLIDEDLTELLEYRITL